MSSEVDNMSAMSWKSNLDQAIERRRKFGGQVGGNKSSLVFCVWSRCPSAVLLLSLLGTGEVSLPPDSEVVSDLRLSFVFRRLGTSGHDVSPPVVSPSANAPGRIRTCDLRIRNPLLYPAELRALQL